MTRRHSGSSTSGAILNLPVSLLLLLLVSIVPPTWAGTSFNFAREYAGATFFDGWDFYGYWWVLLSVHREVQMLTGGRTLTLRMSALYVAYNRDNLTLGEDAAFSTLFSTVLQRGRSACAHVCCDP